MERLQFSFVAGLLICLLESYLALEKCTAKWCTTSKLYSRRVKTYTSCWSWNWFSCSEYSTKHYYKLHCCTGYGYYGNSPCVAACSKFRLPDTYGGCNLKYSNDSVPDRSSSKVERNSGGTCVSPNQCGCCNKGFYADYSDGYCKICPYIPMCDYRNCHSPHGHENECVYCKYENDHKRFERAYKYNNITNACEKTCSWRPDSTRCFPGFCSDEYADTCNCTTGFDSPSSHCTTITQAIDILHAQVKFMDAENTTVSSPEDVNSPRNVPKKWTNNIHLKTMEFSLGAIYKALGDIPKFGEYTETIKGEDKTLAHFVTEFKYGIIAGEMKAILIRDKITAVSLFNENCKDNTKRSSPFSVNEMFSCEKTLKFADQFRHNDELTISVEIENGGYYVYENRDDRLGYKITKKWPTYSVNLKGIKTVESYTFHWDTELPYYYCIKWFCASLPLYVPDTSKSRFIDIHWYDWSDDLSGVDYYEIEVFELETAKHDSEGIEIKENVAPLQHIKGITNLSISVEVTNTGIYAVHLICFDIAGNHKTARAFFLYDNNDIIDLGKGQIEVKNTQHYLERRWITDSSALIEVEWKDRFIKTDHVKHNWLAAVQPLSNIESTYDDRSGKRTAKSVEHVKGIVRFEIVHDVYGTKLKSISTFAEVSNVYAEFDARNVVWDDGDQLISTIRAFDILENYRDETIITYKDSTPPVISNLWLTKGDRVNTAVHSLKELNEMTIEWDVYDYHSGISHLKWRLYSNYSGTVIIHGEIDLPGQGKTQTITECEEKYNTSRGPACYCTKHTGCYHKHFFLKPHIVVGEGNGIVHNRSMGEHDSDYFIDVNVTNMATLVSLKTIKITVDITPPEVGHVNDGVYGSPEVDFQQDLRLDAHWEGFFDHESGVAFYQYEFSDVCFTEEHFQQKSLMNDTVNTFAMYDAPSSGTYYVTVVAYNKAFHMSKPVCSDGVTITTTIPSVKNVIIMNARTKPRLVKETDDHEWYIDKNLNRHHLVNSTSKCKFSDPLTENIEVFPISQSPVLADNVCMNTNSYSTLVTRVIPKIHMLNITWEPVDDASLIDDYEVGFSTVSGSTAPELMTFQSSKHHTHILINHFGVPEGMLFFIIIKSISKSNVKGFQSVGPFILDTTPPQFVGSYIDLYLSGNYLVANWSAASFIDSDSPFSLDYEYAIGHEPYSTNIQQYSVVTEQGSCILSSKYICTATNVSELDWKLNGHHTYYMTIKATNLVGLSVMQTSVSYSHDIVLPRKGIVIDVPGNSSTFTPIKDIEDIDFLAATDHLAVRWTKFYHPHLNLSYYVCVGTAAGICDVDGKRKITDNTNFYLVSGLSLSTFQRYYSTVFAETLTGSAFVSSDGVTIVDPNWSLPDLKILDGENCTDNLPLNASHHDQDTRPHCVSDKDFQVSTTVLSTYFQISLEYLPYITHAFWSIDERHWLGDFWSTFNEMDYQYISINQNTKLTARGLSLEPGRTYRLSLKFCAGDVCFPAIKTSGVTIIPNKPVTGPISIDYTHHTNDTDKMEITFANMYDPDIVDEVEAKRVVSYYEYSLHDSSNGIYHSWLKADAISAINSSFSQLTIHLLGQIDFSKCRIFALRGYNGAGVSQTTFAEIKPCKGQDVVPKIVLDATGEQQLNRDGSIIDGYGHEIYLEETGRWNIEDVDYTPYKNILSAVWHSLRHKNFTWAVIEINTLDALTYYKDFNTIHLSDPCSHPDVVTCGHTESAYINVLFKDESPLEHGKRYTICIHAPSKTLEYETYTEVLQETNECSDGITVDLIPPLTGTIWIGPTTIIQYKFQISTSDIFVNWESFLDIEEYGTASHSTGILQYQVAIGSVEGGSDIVENTNVGIVNHVTFHNLHLQNGHDYFASVKGIDFSGRSSTAHSASVRVDTTPPHLTSKPILIDGRHIRSFTEIQACWKDVFYDLESGIAYYMLEVGSKANIGDIVQSIETTEDCGVPIQYLDIDAHQGHAYFLTVKAVNKANLVTTSSSWGYIYDQSPPEVGQVFDGFLQEDKLNSIDIDFQIDSTQLGAYWKEFYDPHTTIKTYRINVGTCVGCDDVLQAHDVGIIYEFVLKGMNLAIGKIYYTTVTACNTADLCSSVTSDGFIIDNSPPNIGKVKDGADYIDINYQSLRSYVAATWRGFNDPQSGLDKYSFRVGTLLGGDDIISKSELPLTDIAVFSNTSITDEIPTNIRIYITVRAYNKAGLNSEATSNGFLVDDSPPFFSRKPELFQQLGSRRENSIIYRSCMKITWEVSDEESFIERQYISVISHKGGEINSTSTELNGIVRDFTYTRLDLHDGGIYFVTVIACNSAKVCVKKTSDGIFVDNSPPITGTFAIETEHAASLHRHVDGWWMKWSTFKLWLAWIGFSDLHSGIDYYMVSVGSRYMLDDLNSENKPEKFHHNGSGVDKGDEGKVQTFEVDTTKLTDYNYVFISIWAFNNVGLQSDMIHSQFRLIPGGPLELIRRCTSNTCRGHCVCAPKDQRCPIKGTPCVDNTNNNTNTLIAIYDVTDIRELEAEDISFTPSHDILAARWRIVQIQGLLPQWYEWSVGITESIEPEGIIDSSVENVWHPCGQIDNAIYTLPRGKVLNDFQMYSFFVRTWYDSNTFADFKSDGVTVMSKPLTKTNVFGVGVKEHLPGHWKKDIDYILRGGLFTISWHEAFVKASTVIEKFHVYLSTYPGGHDVHKVEIDIPGSVSAVNISRVSLLPGVKYYSNVVGYSYSGQHLTLSSDGFTVDVDKPSVGVVNDGIGHIEIDFQNTSHFVSASWNGFGDHDSGIRKYYWCVQSEFSETDCDVLPYLNVGIQRSISKSINSSIVHSGAKIFSKVYAVDFVGHVSDTATSNGFTIDETPPTPVQLMFTENNMIKNPSFEDSDNNFVDILNMSTTNICGYSKPDHWNSSDNDCICVVGSSKSIAMDGRSFLFLRGSVLQTLYNLEKDNFYSVIFFTAHVPFEDSVLSTKEGYIEFGNERHVFLVYQKQDKYGSEIDVSWHSHTFYFTARNKDVNITYGSMDDTTGILIDKIQFSKVEIVDVRTHPYPILSHAVWLHGWSSIHASWHFVDEESPIVEYLWAIGYKEGSTEIQRYTSVGLNTFAYNYNITLTHTSQVHITVIAINGAGLSSVATAEALFIDLTAPDIEFIYDGIGYDIDSQTTDEIIANWKVEDLESGLSHCEWAVGFSEFGNEIQAFVRISTELSSVSKVFDHSLLASRKVYVTLRCHNKAGLHTKKSSDGVTISDSPPSIQSAQVQILDQPITEYSSKQNFHGNTSIVRLKWMGFEDKSGLDSFHVDFENQNKTVSVSKTILYDHDGDMYCSMTGLDLHDGHFEVRVSAINNAFLSSQPVSTNMSVSTIVPKVSETKSITMSENETNRTLTISWDTYFISAFILYYEVSVGTALNGADIVQWQETTNGFLVMHVPLQVKLYNGMTIYITITAIGPNGKHTTKTIALTV